MEKGDEHIGFGIMGGAVQPLAHAQFVSNYVDFGMNLQEAMEAPRFSKNNADGCEVSIEFRVPGATSAATLRARAYCPDTARICGSNGPGSGHPAQLDHENQLRGFRSPRGWVGDTRTDRSLTKNTHIHLGGQGNHSTPLVNRPRLIRGTSWTLHGRSSPVHQLHESLLEGQLQGELHQPGIIHRIIDRRERGGRSQIGSVSIAAGCAELRMIEQIDSLALVIVLAAVPQLGLGLTPKASSAPS